MRRDTVPVLWLCGPSGVGKSSAGFALFDQLSEAGTAVAYVDLDQLGLLGPAPGDDPRNDRVKAHNLGEVWAGFRAAGIQCLVVSGIVDDAEEVGRHTRRLPGADVTVCRLRVGHDELRGRIRQRGSLLHLTEENVRNAVELDRSDFAGMVVDTAGRSVADVVAQIRAAGWPGRLPPREVSPLPPHTPDDSTAPVLWLCGPPAVGKSTVGFEIFLRVIGAGVPVAYVDLAQIGFCRPAPADDPDHHRLKADQLGRIWAGFRAAGARCLVLSGNVADRETVDRYRHAIPSAAWTVCRLRARPDTLARRITLRGQGGGPGIMGDELRGLPDEQLRVRVAASARIAEVLDHAGIGDLVVDTDGRGVAELAEIVPAAAGGWPRRHIEVPDALAASHAMFFGDRGRAWIAALPQLAADCMERWSLRTDGPPVCGAIALVVPVRTADGTAAVLKLQPIDEETAGEPIALRAWEGHGAVRLLRHDPGTGSMLLERLDAGRTLGDVPDLAALAILSEIIGRLNAVRAPAGIRRLSDVAAAMLDQVPHALTTISDPAERRLIRSCADALAEVLPEPGDRLLHWDLHYYNVLARPAGADPDDGRSPWVAIDPKPLAGDPGFELLPALHNRWDEAAAGGDVRRAVRRRYDLMTEILGLDRRRAAGWTLGRVLQNLLWEAASGEQMWSYVPDRVIARTLLERR